MRRTSEASPDPSSTGLARRALIVSTALALAGGVLGLPAMSQGLVAGAEIPLLLSGLTFATVALSTLLAVRRVPIQWVATTATIYFAVHLSAGAILAMYGRPVEHDNLFIYLLWFFPLLVFNKLVNAPTVGRILARSVIVAPVAMLCLFAPRLVAIFPPVLLFCLASYCLSYVCFGLMFDSVTRYREDFVAERERAESLKVEATLLESISDCFISLDSELRLVYLNDSACLEFAAERAAAMGRTLPEAAPGFVSELMSAELTCAGAGTATTVFEAQDQRHERWYEMRCFPRPDGLSVYFRNVTDRKAAEARIEHLAFYDMLTELPNRVSFRQHLELAFAGTGSRRGTGALLFIDLDDFKTLNDTLGHDVGDVLLTHVAARLRAAVRATDVVARFGGDEFVVMAEDLGEDVHAAARNAAALAEKLLTSLAAPYSIDAIEYVGTASVGITLFSESGDTVDELLKRADLAMYQAKAQGRNSLCFFDPAMQTSVAARAELQADLRAALADGQFVLHYQPQLDGRGRVIGAEALLRWDHPRRGMIFPDEFIPLAEESGLIVGLGRWVLEEACLQLARWDDPELQGLTLAVNVSLQQFFDPNFVPMVLDAVRAAGADPKRLHLEITESSTMTNIDDTIAKMRALKAHGVGFAIDDFGTGYSSLFHLKRLPLDQLKIDRMFVSDMLNGVKDASIVRTLIALGKNLDVSVIAEGVETDSQRAFLEREGCDLFQGYLFSRPVPAGEFEAFAAASRVPLLSA